MSGRIRRSITAQPWVSPKTEPQQFVDQVVFRQIGEHDLGSLRAQSVPMNSNDSLVSDR